MKTRIDILAVSVLAVFMVSAVLHVTSTGASSVEAALLAVESVDALNCEGCANDSGENEGSVACDLVCVPSFVAAVIPQKFLERPLTASVLSRDAYGLAGQTGRPEPYPPRPLFL